MSMKKRILSALLAVVMALGIVTPAMAYDSPDFSDLPASHWAYDAAMRMADQGVILGTGNGEFSPTVKVSVAQFLTLVGRAVFTEEDLAAVEDYYFESLNITRDSDCWYGPYAAAANKAYWINLAHGISKKNLEAEITRYDMAVILTRAVCVNYDGLGFGLGEKEIDTTVIKDYDSIPDAYPYIYKNYVAQAYAYGLIQGDENGNFNGEDTMTRAEVAVVMDRLMEQIPAFKEAQIQKEAAEEAVRLEAIANYDPDSVELVQGEKIRIDTGFKVGTVIEQKMRIGETLRLTVREVPKGYGYTKDDVTWESDDESVAVISEDGVLTIVGEGQVRITATIPVRYDAVVWTEAMDSLPIDAVP